MKSVATASIARTVTASVSLPMTQLFSNAAPSGGTRDGSSGEPGERGWFGDRNLVWFIGAVAAAVAASSAAAPTGLRPADALWCAGLAALVTVAASRARRWPSIWFAGVISAGSIGSWWVAAALLALALAVSTAYSPYRNRVIGAAVGALGVQALLRMPAQGFHGLPSLIALVALAPLLSSGYDRSSRRVQRRTRRVIYGAVAVAALITAAFGLSVLLASHSLTSAVKESEDGLDLIRDGKQDDAAGHLAVAADQFEEANHLLGGSWTWPARLVPVLAQHRDALVVASKSGHDLAGTGASAAATAPYQRLKTSKGQADVKLMTKMQKPVSEATVALEAAQHDMAAARSSWLLAPLAAQLDEFAGQIDGTLPEAQLAQQALAVAPAMLGSEGDKTYLVLFTNPAETRFLGGFTGSYGILTAHKGKVDFSVSGRITDLVPEDQLAKLDISGDRYAEYLQRYGRYETTKHLQNLTASPDMPTDADITRTIYQQATGTSVDGVVVVDPYGLAGLLQLTGPVDVPGFAAPITADNAAAYLVFQQYADYGDERTERKDRLEAAGKAVFQALTSRDLPGPRTLGQVLGPLVEQKRLLFYPFDAADVPLFEQIGTTGAFQPDLDTDFLSLRTANANPNKIDSFLHRSVSYDVAYDPGNGNVDATATIALTNDAPAGGLPYYLIGNSRFDAAKNPLGSNELYLSWYSPLDLIERAGRRQGHRGGGPDRGGGQGLLRPGDHPVEDDGDPGAAPEGPDPPRPDLPPPDPAAAPRAIRSRPGDGALGGQGVEDQERRRHGGGRRDGDQQRREHPGPAAERDLRGLVRRRVPMLAPHGHHRGSRQRRRPPLRGRHRRRGGGLRGVPRRAGPAGLHPHAGRAPVRGPRRGRCAGVSCARRRATARALGGAALPVHRRLHRAAPGLRRPGRRADVSRP